uniref:ATP synthase subunit b n=1 Tax=Koribacter versatilis (strain Ellin345) TaxID=204669 RepID=ATPF_KORVE|nr:RecName: Full=ATP synthase subunit b; AltName: Full=ATP synthase F(0) sector subunit b; AltName: Full=ATPase subunit I; AltName: Full=F-type ATPase subunit b; Short=F-ATPase subunit b [Candidatus Koribacter versatilis Ellin345]
MYAQEAQQKPEAQQSAPAAEQPKPAEEQAKPEQHVTNPNAAVGKELSEASHAAEGEEEAGEHMELKHSTMVKTLAKWLGVSVETSYWIAMAFNFAIVFALLGWAMKKNLPGVFKARNESIQRGIAEARAASDDAKRRLADIEARLSKMDGEVAAIRAVTEKESAAEEVRIREAAEADVKRILESAENEIDAATKQARRDLKSLAAGLAIDLATRKLHVDQQTDESLVRSFVAQLGKDGK